MAKITDIPTNYRTCKASELSPVIWNVESVPEQRLRDKMARTRNWVVNESRLNEAEKRFDYVIISGPNSSVKKAISFEEACNDFGWDSFEITANKQTIVPKFTLPEK